jgi:uncharacterized RDD family membrane protein YckC
MKKKITEIEEKRYRTERVLDSNGNRTRQTVEYIGHRKVNVVSGGKRFAHFFIDLLIYYLIYHLILQLLSLFVVEDKPSIKILIIGVYFSIFLMFLFPLYYIVFEFLLQRTPGKFLTKTIVIDIYGNKPELGNNVLRNILRMVPFEIFSCLNDRGWHDRWSDTYVVSMEEYNIIQELLALDLVNKNFSN